MILIRTKEEDYGVFMDYEIPFNTAVYLFTVRELSKNKLHKSRLPWHNNETIKD